MQERLHIKNFAGIKEVTLELRRMNVLIGPQATGKSVCAKLLYHFKGFLSDIFAAVENQETMRDLDAAFLQKFEQYFPPASWGKGAFHLRYELGGAFVEICRGEGRQSKPDLSYSATFRELFEHCLGELKKARRKQAEWLELAPVKIFQELQQAWIEAACTQLGDEAGFTQVFIPAGRSFFANLQSSVFSLLSTNQAIDPLLAEFGRFYEGLRHLPADRQTEHKNGLSKRLQTLTEFILRGKHVEEKGKDFLQLPDGRRVNIANASSGQQEMLPLAIILSVLPFLGAANRGFTVYIEEPEAHLFPNSQRAIVQLLATVFNRSKAPVQFIVTTHSPYILTAANNLMQAGHLIKRLPQKDHGSVHAVVPEDQILVPDAVRAYALEAGTANLICCEDTGLISADVIDDVSNDLSIQFGELLEME
ncbi:MAG: AAA family ATPase [Candidatus Hydrogenedentota bacterium]